MDVSPVQLSKTGPGRIRSTALVNPIGILMLIAVLLACGFLWRRFERRGMVTTHGSVLQTRIDMTYRIGNILHSGQSYECSVYQIKACVRYDWNGQTQEVWMPASNTLTWELPLEKMLARNPRTCIVYWSAKYPQNPWCEFERPWRWLGPN
jgi:hypothetical protein